MRFISDGPDIGVSLIREWLHGNVVFLAGAGISMPAPSSLPSFRDLALQVYARLHDPLHPLLVKLGAKTQNAQQSGLLKSGLKPAQIHEGQLFFSGQFDRLFSALEVRLDHDPDGRPFQRSVRNAVEDVLRSGGVFGQGHRDLVELSSGGSPNQRRIVTTNFDRLLEDAWLAGLHVAPPCCDARMGGPTWRI